MRHNRFPILNLFHLIIIWNISAMAKVIHVHIFSRPRGEIKDYYFSSITAVYSVLSAEDIGARKSYLLHCGLSGGGSIITKKAIIKQSVLIGNCKKKMEQSEEAPSTNEFGRI